MTTQENLTNYYKTFHADGNIPIDHINYLKKIKDLYEQPKVIYDIGSAVLHWTKIAKNLWPNAKIIAFEAVKEVEDFYKEYGLDYSLEVFTDIDNKEIIFYEDPICLGGNSYYKENSKYSPAADKIYNENSAKKRIGKTIDTIVNQNKFPLPDFLKIDVQGAEVDILKGMSNTLKFVKHLIIEIQHVEYNLGALPKKQSIEFIKSLGFKLANQHAGNEYFCGNGPDADYHFIKE